MERGKVGQKERDKDGSGRGGGGGKKKRQSRQTDRLTDCLFLYDSFREPSMEAAT